MISFYPGPSKVYPQVKDFMAEAYDSGILSVNHRSLEFVEVSKKVIQLMQDKLNIPNEFTIFFTSSATECWEIIGQSFIDLYSFHLYNGAFGEKWMEYRKKLMPNASGLNFNPQKTIGINKLKQIVNPDLICLTQNETSNATQVKNKTIGKIKKQFRDALICVDATSSLAGIELEWRNADIWYASVQKCFGLPAGLGVMICSKRAVNKAQELNNNQHYNSLPFLTEKMKDFQTTYTPNVLSIYLLMKVMEMVPNIEKVHNKTKARALEMNKFLIKNGYSPLIQNANVRSYTVLGVKDNPDRITQIKKAAKKAGLLLGNGYGNWKSNSFRIANFPAVTDEEFDQLKGFLSNYPTS
ncbi:MAG: aminotransferase class V-fold PLP-dependent enzyme [Flammeovirgaceae bacterium]|nr:aminotransferase class V-fold PLP-dependent enzyme [Flammeovirgaceae bacterium]